MQWVPVGERAKRAKPSQEVADVEAVYNHAVYTQAICACRYVLVLVDVFLVFCIS